MIKHDKKVFSKLLLDWYYNNARILPWREDKSAYRIWVSEIMLQQTRVEAVRPYFERFMIAISTIEQLANTSDDTLHKLWEGLGYYHRVKNMKLCARVCVDLHMGKLPYSAKELKQLPGIGDYTAGAIASIAYGEHIAAVDGNVLRVFSRVLISEDDILKESTKKRFQDIILDYIPSGKSSEFNQALMELGALICVPNGAPRCNICPLSQQCLGFHSGDAHRLPNKTKKKKRRIEEKTIIIVVCQDKILIHKRSHEGLLAGLYEFLTVDGKMIKKDISLYLNQYNIIKTISLQPTKHIFSHVEWHMKGYIVEVKEMNEGIWCNFDDIQQLYAIPTAFKVYKEALNGWIKEK